MPWGLEPGSQPLSLPASPSRAGPVLPCPAPPRQKGSPCPLGRDTQSPALPFSATPTLSASQGRSLVSISSASRRESWRLHHGKASSPVELEIRSAALTPDPACSPPCALPRLDSWLGSGSSSHSPHQSSCTRAVDTQAAGRWAVGESISLPLIYRGPGAPDHQAVGNFSSVHDVSPK